MSFLSSVHKTGRSWLNPLTATWMMLFLTGCVGSIMSLDQQDYNASTFDVSGIVTSADSGLPIAGGVVEINNRTTTTKEDGTYSLKGIPTVSGRVFYQVTADDHLPYFGSIAVSNGANVILNVDLNAMSSEGTAKITGRINFAAPDFHYTQLSEGWSIESCPVRPPSTRPIPTMAVTPNDPCFPYQHYLEQINVPMAWSVTTGSRDIVVAVIDSGVDPDHPDLAPNLIKGRNFVDDHDPDTMIDLLGHGTAVSSLIGAVGNNGTGMAGVAWNVSIMPLRTTRLFSGPRGVLEQAIRYAVDHGADIISIAATATSDDEPVREAVRYATDRNVIVVAAVGNLGPDMGTTRPPAMYDGVIGVGALTHTHKATASFFSARGEGIYVVAPGELVLVPVLGGAYGQSGGTSFAAPLVSGVVALMLSNGIEPGEVADILRRTAVQIGDPENNLDDLYTYGYGMVNAYGAVTATDPKDTKLFVLAPNGDVVSAITSPDEFRKFEIENVPAGNNLTLVGWIDVNETGFIDRGDYLGTARFSVADGDEKSLYLSLDVVDGSQSMDLLSTMDLALVASNR